MPSSSGTRPSSAASSVDLPEPFAPVIATRSRPVDLQVDRPERERRRGAPPRRAASPHRARPRRRGDLHPQLPLLARLLDHLEPLDHPVGLPGLGRLLLRLASHVARGCLSGSVRLAARVADALVHPVALHPGARLQVGLRLGVLLVLLAGVPAGHLPLVQVGRRSRRRRRCTCCWARSSSSTRVTVRVEELAVVADQHGAGPQAGDEALQPVQPVQVEVVGRLVEQQHVVAATAAATPARPGPPGRRRAPVIGGPGRRRGPRSAATCLGALVQVGAAEGRASAPGRRRTRRRRPASPAASACGRGVHARACAAATPVRRAQELAAPSRPAARSGSCGR